MTRSALILSALVGLTALSACGPRINIEPQTQAQIVSPWAVGSYR